MGRVDKAVFSSHNAKAQNAVALRDREPPGPTAQFQCIFVSPKGFLSPDFKVEYGSGFVLRMCLPVLSPVWATGSPTIAFEANEIIPKKIFLMGFLW